MKNLSTLLFAVGLLVAWLVAERFAASQEFLIDLDVYRMGGRAVIDGAELYSLEYPVANLPFLYPPFAAIAFVPWALLDLSAAAVVWTVLTLAALGRSCQLLGRAVERGSRLSPGVVALGLFLVAVLLEPLRENLRFGQINVVIMWMVLEDLLGRPARLRGALAGVATGLKLTPGVFVLFLAITGRAKEALRAAVVAAATVGVGFLVLPAESWRYWTGIAYDDSRVGVGYISNQSINGSLTRLLGEDPSRLLVLGLSASVIVLSLVVGRRLWFADRPVAAVATVALGTVLASPISWTHHWIWIIVVLAGLAEVAVREARTLVRRSSLALLVITAIVTTSNVIWMPPHEGGAERHHSGLELVAGNAYVLLAFVLLALAAWYSVRPAEQPGKSEREPSSQREPSRESV